MADLLVIPGYEEAVAQEQKERSFAWLGLSDVIAGVEVLALTPVAMDWLRAFKNPFISGGKLSRMATQQFLWINQPDFCPKKLTLEAFSHTHVEINYELAIVGIHSYIEATFMDAPHGPASIPYYSPTAGLVRAMSGEPYNWNYKVTLITPLRIIYQLLRADRKANGLYCINRKSDGVRGDWLNKRHAEILAEREKNPPPPVSKGKARKGK